MPRDICVRKLRFILAAERIKLSFPYTLYFRLVYLLLFGNIIPVRRFWPVLRFSCFEDELNDEV